MNKSQVQVNGPVRHRGVIGWVAAVVIGSMLLAGCAEAKETKAPQAAKVETKKAPAAVAEPAPVKPAEPQVPAKPATPSLKITAKVRLETSAGAVVVGLYGEDAPNTVANFLSYVDQGYYTGKVFHRVIAGFMIQGGGFNEAMERVEGQPPIKLEIIPGLKHEPGVLSMARTRDPHSATSQFYICVGSPAQLNGSYAAFGKTLEGYEVVEAISKTKKGVKQTPMGPMRDVPVEPIVILSAKRI